MVIIDSIGSDRLEFRCKLIAIPFIFSTAKVLSNLSVSPSLTKGAPIPSSSTVPGLIRATSSFVLVRTKP